MFALMCMGRIYKSAENMEDEWKGIDQRCWHAAIQSYLSPKVIIEIPF